MIRHENSIGGGGGRKHRKVVKEEEEQGGGIFKIPSEMLMSII